LHKKRRHPGIRTGSGSDRVGSEQKNAIGEGAMLGFSYNADPVATAPGSDIASPTVFLTFAPNRDLSTLVILASQRLGGKMT
jgi:hypothetical protein